MSEGPPWNTFAEFLAKAPPGTEASLPKVLFQDTGGIVNLACPRVQLDCESDICDGIRYFDSLASSVRTGHLSGSQVIEYLCSNCRRSIKSFAIRFAGLGDGLTKVIKIGEYPPFGGRLPSGLVTLIREDKEAFFKGYRCEKQGLGVGAFAYYRRIVEGQRSRLIQKMIDVAKLLGASQDSIRSLEAAKVEQQFKKSVEMVRDFIPAELKIAGHNPLQLLHNALSEGVHGLPDEECLRRATSIRIVLIDFADRLEIALREHTSLKAAISTLLNPNQ